MQAATIDVPAGFGIRLTAIPQPADPSCKFIRVYMSEADGDVLHSAAQLAVGATQYDLGKRALGRLLDTQLLDRMPPGTIVRAYLGRTSSGLGHRAVYSDPLRPGLTSRKGNYFAFP